MEYKPCCDRRCLVHGCKIREKGGCICLCSLFDHMSSLESMEKGNTILYGIGNIYYADIEKAKELFDRLSEDEKKRNLHARLNAKENIDKIKEKIKTYENNG